MKAIVKNTELSLNALRSLYKTGKLNLKPAYQRKLQGNNLKSLKASLQRTAAAGSILGGIVLRDTRGIEAWDYEVLDGRRRLTILLKDESFDGKIPVPTQIYSDLSETEAIQIFEDLNVTSKLVTTGEVLNSTMARPNTAPSLKRFMKNPVWGRYDSGNDSRFKGYRYGVFFFAEAHALRAGTKTEQIELVKTFQEANYDEKAAEAMLEKIERLQSIVRQTVDFNPRYPLKVDTFWPIGWLYRAIEENPALETKSIRAMAKGFVQWLNTHSPAEINTSQPMRSVQMTSEAFRALQENLTQA